MNKLYYCKKNKTQPEMNVWIVEFGTMVWVRDRDFLPDIDYIEIFSKLEHALESVQIKLNNDQRYTETGEEYYWKGHSNDDDDDDDVYDGDYYDYIRIREYQIKK